MKSPLQQLPDCLGLCSPGYVLPLACQQSQQPAAPARLSPRCPHRESFVVFEGPWAIVPDPKDANSVLVLAPKTKLHAIFYVSATNESS